MKLASLILGIVTVVGMLIGLIPCFGWFNWLNLPLAIVGIVLGMLAYNEDKKMPPMHQEDYNPMGTQRNADIPIGLILCCVAFVFGGIRLVIGGGIF